MHIQGGFIGMLSQNKTKITVLMKNHHSQLAKDGINWYFPEIFLWILSWLQENNKQFVKKIQNNLIFRGKLRYTHTYPWLFPFKEKDDKPEMLEVVKTVSFISQLITICPFIGRKRKNKLCFTSFSEDGRSAGAPPTAVLPLAGGYSGRRSFPASSHGHAWSCHHLQRSPQPPS